MHRFLVTTDLLKLESPALPAEAAHHLRVLRPESGERAELFDGRGMSRVYRLEATGNGREFSLQAEGALEVSPRPAVELVLFACVTKGSRWDWTIEKATELGVSRIVPVISDRTIVRIPAGERAAKRMRWQRIAEDAARQSDAKWVPEVVEPVDFKSSLPLVSQTDCFVGALTNPPSPSLAQEVIKRCSEGISRALSVYIGPEGDFTPAELSALLEVAIPTSFGTTILRAETAAIYALSVVSGVKMI